MNPKENKKAIAKRLGKSEFNQACEKENLNWKVS